MSKGFEVFNIAGEQLNYEVEQAKSTLEAKLNPAWIKKRSQGNFELSYIGGHTVIRLLNKAFNYQWSFEIVSEEIVQSLPKNLTQWNNQTRRKEVVGTEEQPPVAKVLGRLTVPGLGVKEQYGSKVLIGGATEQESAFKSASTDALKKCASLFGIGLELYGDDEGFADEPQQSVTPQQPAPQQPPVQQAPPAPPVQGQPATPPPAQQQAPAKQEQAPMQQASGQQANPSAWDPSDINKLKELKAIVGITDNNQLDPYVREFLDSPEMTYLNITPQNIKAFNIFMAKKAENL